MQLHQVDIVYLKCDLDPLKSPWDRKKLNCIVLQVENFCSFIIMGLKQEGRAQKGRSQYNKTGVRNEAAKAIVDVIFHV